jgi:hypothetical protein
MITIFIALGLTGPSRAGQVYRKQNPQIITNLHNKASNKKLSNGKKTVPGQDDS